ncbi:short-subunit dehydrogenase [Bacillus pakistanensis]|uniref:Short-subunit dehydrogenase n=1 Tax=Rossellomorea pakistanensis TaxID=992288 RepID=A0ABS2N7N1_9BACI|nr:SDR family oxidoreductase [Bacillus pakistanensis]MBM7583861.1 short-subunit dehydrogenase [Bacillus pakistanensis]
MDQKIAVITGSSSGFGLLTSLEFARKGFKVIATMRNLEKSKELEQLAKKENLHHALNIHALDVTNNHSVSVFKDFIKSIGRVDVLVNNAGYAMGGFSEEITIDEYQQQFETNFFGVIRITNTILPFMRNQGDGLIVNVSSISGLVGFPGISPYVASKHALEGYSESLRLELKPNGISVALVEPGSFNTNIWTTGKKVSLLSQNIASPYHNYMRKIEAQMKKGERNYGNPKQVASLITSLADKHRYIHLRYPVGKGVKSMKTLKHLLPWRLWEKIFLLRIFNK